MRKETKIGKIGLKCHKDTTLRYINHKDTKLISKEKVICPTILINRTAGPTELYYITKSYIIHLSNHEIQKLEKQRIKLNLTKVLVTDLPKVLDIKDRLIVNTNPKKLKILYDGQKWLPNSIRIAFYKDISRLTVSEFDARLEKIKKERDAAIKSIDPVMKRKILSAFKNNGYELCEKFEATTQYIFPNEIMYNYFVEQAIQCYINHIVNDLTYTVPLAKENKRTHKRDYREPIIDLLQIKTNTEKI